MNLPSIYLLKSIFNLLRINEWDLNLKTKNLLSKRLMKMEENCLQILRIRTLTQKT